jgi:hypothetical protein
MTLCDNSFLIQNSVSDVTCIYICTCTIDKLLDFDNRENFPSLTGMTTGFTVRLSLMVDKTQAEWYGGSSFTRRHDNVRLGCSCIFLGLFPDAMYQLDTTMVTGRFKILSREGRIRYNHRSSKNPRLTIIGWSAVATGTIEGMKLEGEETLTIFEEKPSTGAKMSDMTVETRHTLPLDRDDAIIPGKCRSSPKTLGCRAQSSAILYM